MNKSLDGILEDLRSCGNYLIPYTFPQNIPLLEDIIFPLRVAEIMVDGYKVGLHYAKADYEDHYLESLQISSVNTPFLPFHVVIKIARKALGGYYLSLIRTSRNSKVYYCWAVCVDDRGRPLPFQHPAKITQCEYEGFEFGLLSMDSVNFH